MRGQRFSVPKLKALQSRCKHWGCLGAGDLSFGVTVPGGLPPPDTCKSPHLAWASTASGVLGGVCVCVWCVSQQGGLAPSAPVPPSCPGAH